MLILPQEKYEIALRSYSASKAQFPIIYSVLSGLQNGKVYVNDPELPEFFFVHSGFGFAQYFGILDEKGKNQLQDLIFQPSDLDVKYLLWYNPEDEWISKTENSELKGSYKIRERVRLSIPDSYDLPPSQIEIGTQMIFSKPENENELAEGDVFELDLDSRFWKNKKSLMDQGVVVYGKLEGKLASICYSASVSNREAEVDVLTLPAFRGRGLGFETTRVFIQECQKKNLKPSWDCFEDNEASIRLASTLGFEEYLRYPFLSIYREFTD